METRRAEDIGPGFEALKGRADALYVVGDPLRPPTGSATTPWRWARDCRPCTLTESTSRAAGLMSYGPNFPDLFRRAADFVDKVCAGQSPLTFRLSSRPSSTSSSTSPPPRRSVSRCRRRFWHVLMR